MPAPTPSPHEAAFLETIKRADWFDNTPRLVYADWLEEHDQAERAAFVRDQVRRADPWTTESDLRTLTKEERFWLNAWVGKPPKDVTGRFHRGLLVIHTRAGRFLIRQFGANLLDAWRQGWVESLGLWRVENTHVRRLPERLEGRVVRLGLQATQWTVQAVQGLATLPQLERLDLGLAWPPACLAVLTALPRLRWLKLSLRWVPLGVGLSGVAAIAPLRVLHLLDWPPASPADLHQFATLSQVKHLRLSNSAANDDLLPYLISLTGLRQLSLACPRITEAGLKALRSQLPHCRVEPIKRSLWDL